MKGTKLLAASYKIEDVRRLATDASVRYNRRARALIKILDYAVEQARQERWRDRFKPVPPPPTPDGLDPDAAAAVRRRYADERFFQDWETFKQRYGITRKSTQDDIRRAFSLWSKGKYIMSQEAKRRWRLPVEICRYNALEIYGDCRTSRAASAGHNGRDWPCSVSSSCWQSKKHQPIWLSAKRLAMN